MLLHHGSTSFFSTGAYFFLCVCPILCFIFPVFIFRWFYFLYYQVLFLSSLGLVSRLGDYSSYLALDLTVFNLGRGDRKTGLFTVSDVEEITIEESNLLGNFPRINCASMDVCSALSSMWLRLTGTV